MKFSFTDTIYKVGINPCVKVPFRITNRMVPSGGYIPVKGKINGYEFTQTLVAVKNEEYRLYVNGLMLKGSVTKVGDTARFIIEQNLAPKTPPMHKKFKKQLDDNHLSATFKKLTPYRQKEILKYLNHLKTEEAIVRNIDKIVKQLKRKSGE